MHTRQCIRQYNVPPRPGVFCEAPALVHPSGGLRSLHFVVFVRAPAPVNALS